MAQRNNTWSLHVHMGVRGADRAIAVCDWMRELLPLLLAISANSPFLDGRDSGLHTVRTEIFTRTFPRCGVPSAFRDWDSYADFVATLERTGSIVESTQLWWSVRPHHQFGTVEVRICDAQTRGDESFALAGLIAACIAQAAIDYDEHGYEGAGAPLADREIEENLWRAIRHGLSGKMIDFRRGMEVETREMLESILAWAEPARSQLGIDLRPPERNGAQRAREALDAWASIEDIYRDAVAETRAHLRGCGTGCRSRPRAASGRRRRSSIDSRAAKSTGGTKLDRLLDRLRGSRRARMRGRRRRLRTHSHPAPACQVPWQRPDAGNLGSCPGGRTGLPEPPVHDHRRGRGAARDRALAPAGLQDRDRLRDRRRPLRRHRLHRDERLGAGQLPRRRGRPRRCAAGARRRLQGRLGHRAPRRRPGAARRRRLLRDPGHHRQHRQGGRRRADRPRLRWLADLRLRPARRRHLHQGRRRRRRPGRQGRGGDPRGRSAQPGRDRRQRRRQRRRLRRHGRRPVRDLRGHLGRRDAARRPHLHHRLRPRGRDLPAGHRRRRDHRLDRRGALGADQNRQSRGRAVRRHDRLRRASRSPPSTRSPTG